MQFVSRPHFCHSCHAHRRQRHRCLCVPKQRAIYQREKYLRLLPAKSVRAPTSYSLVEFRAFASAPFSPMSTLRSWRPDSKISGIGNPKCCTTLATLHRCFRRISACDKNPHLELGLAAISGFSLPAPTSRSSVISTTDCSVSSGSSVGSIAVATASANCTSSKFGSWHSTSSRPSLTSSAPHRPRPDERGFPGRQDDGLSREGKVGSSCSSLTTARRTPPRIQ